MDQSFRVSQRVLVDGYGELVVCDVRDDGTAYAQGDNNERVMICDRGAATMVVETLPVGRCKCLARSYQDHQDRVRHGEATPHVYSGVYWSALNDEKNGIDGDE